MVDDLSIPSRDAVFQDFRNRLEADARRLATLWGNHAVHALIGKPAPASPGLVMPSLNLQPWEFRGEDIDVSSLPAGQLVASMYDYAIEFRHPIGLDTSTFAAEVEAIEDLACSLSSDMFELFLQDLGGYSADVHGALRLLWQHTSARLRLDLGDSVSISQLALLARMNERSVRNAVSASSEEQRLNVRHDLVDNAEARRWLAGRRGYTPTLFTDISEIPGEHPSRIGTLLDLGRYIDGRWAGLGKSPESVLRELDWPSSRAEYLRAITSDPHRIDPRDCDSLARSLLVSSVWFTEQVLRLLYPRQMELLLSAQTSTPSTTNDAPTVGPHLAQKQDISTRLIFVLHDGTRLYPARMKNRETKKVAFRLSPGGAGGNTLEAGLEIESEDEMLRLVVDEGYAVRMTGEAGGMKSLYKLGGRSVQAAYLDGELIGSDA